MLEIKKPIDFIIKVLGQQKIIDTSYRHITYIQTCEISDGVLIYNLMTREFVLLSYEEFKAFEVCDLKNPSVRKLAENWFIVSADNDDYTLFRQTENMLKTMVDSQKPPLTHFTIYPTTDCNARCFYCFELACNRISMTEQTANDVADFIIDKSNGKQIGISWFGGEPLYNYLAIDTVTKRLNENNINYISDMVSNGYIFDEKLIKRAYGEWNLRKVQITLDGTEEVYNKCKAYIYNDVSSPFLRVMNNIELLLKNDIYVNIRLNMDLHNYDDLVNLVDIIKERFSVYDKCKVYIAILYENVGKKFSERTKENKRLLYERYDYLENKLNECNMSTEYGIEMYRKVKHCMADTNDCTLILPDGHLGKCEHFTDDKFYGSIYDDKINYENINIFKETFEFGDFCHTCPLQPKCIPLKICPCGSKYCDDFEKELKIKSLKKQMKTTYKYYLLRQQNSEQNESCDLPCS